MAEKQKNSKDYDFSRHVAQLLVTDLALMGLSKKHVVFITFLLVITIFGSLVGFITLKSIRQGMSSYSVPFETQPTRPPDDWRGIEVFVNISAINPLELTINLRFSFIPYGSELVSGQDKLGRELAIPVEMILEDKPIFFESGQSMSNIDHQISFFDGSIAYYPFDKYLGDLVLSGYSIDANGTKSLIPLQVTSVGALQGYNIDLKYANMSKTNPLMVVGLYVTVQRTWIWKGFAIFIQLTMWILSSAVALMAIGILVSGQKVIPPVIGLCTAMLFALPKMRNQQPGSPPVGIQADILGFFWNMLFVTAAGKFFFNFSVIHVHKIHL